MSRKNDLPDLSYEEPIINKRDNNDVYDREILREKLGWHSYFSLLTLLVIGAIIFIVNTEIYSTLFILHIMMAYFPLPIFGIAAVLACLATLSKWTAYIVMHYSKPQHRYREQVASSVCLSVIILFIGYLVISSLY